MNGVKVTVIVPVYNTEQYLSECVNSILNQSLREIELICIDDGSTDTSYKLLQDHAKKDPRMIVLQQENKGPGAARNFAITKAGGDYVTFVDSDDYIHEDMLKELYNTALSDELEIVMCTIRKFSSDPNDEYPKCVYDKFIPKDLDNKVFGSVDIHDVLFNLRFSACNKMYKKSFLIEQQVRFSEGIFYEDMMFTYKALLISKRMRFIRRDFYFNRKLREGATTFTQGSRAYGSLSAMVELERFIKDRPELHSLEERFLAFKFKKILSYLYLNDANHIDKFYNELKTFALTSKLKHNPYLNEDQRKALSRILKVDLLEFLLGEYFDYRVNNTILKRQIKALVNNNKKTKKRIKKLKSRSLKGKFKRIIRKLSSFKKDIVDTISWLTLSTLGTIVPKNKKKIIVLAPFNGSFSDNSKYAYLWLKEETNLDIIYLTYDKATNNQLLENGITSTGFPSFQAIFHLLRASVLVEVAAVVPYRNIIGHLSCKAKLVQLWHGAGLKNVHLGNKKYESIKKSTYKKFQSVINRSYPNFDVFYFPSQIIKEERKNFFNFKDSRVSGFVRNDCLLGKSFNSKEDFYTDHNVAEQINNFKTQGSRLVLYAPTYRKRDTPAFGYQIPIDFDLINKVMKRHNTYFVIKLHPWMNEEIDFSKFENILVYDKDKDIYPLLGQFDMMITDYSSIFSDFALLDRPIIHYFPDYDKAITNNRISREMANKMLGIIYMDFDELLDCIESVLNYTISPNKFVCKSVHEYKDKLSGPDLVSEIKKLTS